MNGTIYHWLNEHHGIVNVILILDFSWVVANLLAEVMIKRLISGSSFFGNFDANADDNKRPLFQQLALLLSTILTNSISIFVYSDYWRSSQIILIIISIAQIISLLYFFIACKSKVTNQYLKLSLILGMLNIILTFTHIYFFAFVNNHYTGFANFDVVGMNNSNSLDDWMNCFFYAISLIIPYSLTELIPNTFLFKFISLLQIGVFYIFIFEKLGEIFHDYKLTKV